jgi:nucleotide-binding universal stress UspA family protein
MLVRFSLSFSFLFFQCPAATYAPELFAEIEAENKKRAVDYLKPLARQLMSSGVTKPRLVLARGEPRDTLCFLASEYHAALIVMGTRGLSSVKRTLLGSVSTHAIHSSPCPVAVVRTTE